MPRFVLLAHDHPFVHWDLMLEAGSALRTWRLHALPRVGIAVVAESLGEHRLAYLDYEGPVSGGRGTVKRVDSGDFEWVVNELDCVELRITGNQLRGRLRLARDLAGWKCIFL